MRKRLNSTYYSGETSNFLLHVVQLLRDLAALKAILLPRQPWRMQGWSTSEEGARVGWLVISTGGRDRSIATGSGRGAIEWCD